MGHLTRVPAPEGRKGEWYRRSGTWPPAADFFQGDVIGLAYYIPKWFRFGLQAWITQRMRELEAKEGVYSLEGWNETRAGLGSYDTGKDSSYNDIACQVVDASGDYRNADGLCLAADVEMMEKPLDVSALDAHALHLAGSPRRGVPAGLGYRMEANHAAFQTPTVSAPPGRH